MIKSCKLTSEKKKAKELFEKYYKLLFLREKTKQLAKDASKVVVEEMLNRIQTYDDNGHTKVVWHHQEFEFRYWNKVLTEIEKL